MSKATKDDNPEKLRETVVQQEPDNPFCSQGRGNSSIDGINHGDQGKETREEIEKLRETLKETKQILVRTTTSSNKKNCNLKVQIEDVRQLNKCLLKEVQNMENSNSKDMVMDELKCITTTTYDVSSGVFYHLSLIHI